LVLKREVVEQQKAAARKWVGEKGNALKKKRQGTIAFAGRRVQRRPLSTKGKFFAEHLRG